MVFFAPAPAGEGVLKRRLPFHPTACLQAPHKTNSTTNPSPGVAHNSFSLHPQARQDWDKPRNRLLFFLLRRPQGRGMSGWDWGRFPPGRFHAGGLGICFGVEHKNFFFENSYTRPDLPPPPQGSPAPTELSLNPDHMPNLNVNPSLNPCLRQECPISIPPPYPLSSPGFVPQAGGGA